jgi:hypothetical protein
VTCDHGGEVGDHGDEPVGVGAEHMGPLVFVDPDHPHPIQAGRAGGQQQLTGRGHGDAVHGVPAAAQLARDRGDGGLVESQAPQDERRAASGGRRARAGQPAAVVGEDLPDAAVVDTPVARQPHPQLERVPDDRDVGDTALDGVAVHPDQAATWAGAGPVGEQVTPQHRGLTVHGGVGDPHPELDGPNDRVGHDLSRNRRRLRHRAPGDVDDLGVGTFIINFPGPASPQRHDPSPAPGHTLTCTPFPEEPVKGHKRFMEVGRTCSLAPPLPSLHDSADSFNPDICLVNAPVSRKLPLTL